jgi:hypothetical protein
MEFSDFHARIDKLEQEFNSPELRVKIANSASMNQRLELNNIITNPSEVIAEKPYTVELVSGEKLSVIVSNSIAEDVFKQSHRAKVVSRSLKKIQLGIFGRRYNGDGVIRTYTDNNVVEIRATGTDGSFRLYGYLEDNVLHIVYSSMSSNHDGTIVKKNAQRVIAIRQLREQ